METDIRAPHGYRDIFCCHCGLKITVPVRCTSKLCIPCRHARLFRIRQRLYATLAKFKPSDGYAWKHLILTIPNTMDLYPGIKHIVSSFRRFRQTKSWKSHVAGGFYIIEITNKGHQWHPHLHVICYAKFYPWQQIYTRWHAASKNGAHIHVKQIWNNVGIAGYISQYLTKIPHLDHADAITYDLDTKSMRMYNSFGNLHVLFGQTKLPKYQRPCPKCQCTSWQGEEEQQRLIRRYCPIRTNKASPF